MGGKETHEIQFQEHVVNRGPLQQGPCFERKRYGMVAGGGLGEGQLAKLQIGREFQQGHVHTTQPIHRWLKTVSFMASTVATAWIEIKIETEISFSGHISHLRTPTCINSASTEHHH